MLYIYSVYIYVYIFNPMCVFVKGTVCCGRFCVGPAVVRVHTAGCIALEGSAAHVQGCCAIHHRSSPVVQHTCRVLCHTPQKQSCSVVWHDYKLRVRMYDVTVTTYAHALAMLV